MSEWILGRTPEDLDDGSLLLVVLKRRTEPETDPFYSGHPVVVSCWGHKLKTTWGEDRISPDEVLKWRQLDG